MHVELEEEYFGAGTYYFEDTQLPRWRKLVAADKTGKQIAGIVSKLRKAGYAVGGHDDYKKVPKGFAPDHPRAELLKMRGLTAGFPALPKGHLHKADARGLVAAARQSDGAARYVAVSQREVTSALADYSVISWVSWFVRFLRIRCPRR